MTFGGKGDHMQEEQKQRPWFQALPRLFLLALALAVLTMALPAQAASKAGTAREAESEKASGGTRKVIPMGRAVGIKLFSDGVMVVGLADVDTGGGSENPARQCGLREGDIITHINSEEVDSIEEVQSILQDLSGERMSIRAMRGDREVQMTAQAVKCSADGCYKLGAWIRDSMAGIGTMTFYDPATYVFGALGHGVSDVDTARLMPLQSGSIMYAEVSDVKRGVVGAPGELHGVFRVEQDLGELYANTASGVFGTLTDEKLTGGAAAVEVAERSQIKTGKAVILSNIAGDRVEEYEVEITRVYPDGGGENRDMTLKVTDRRLLEATGGIVQGMSGSPILQNGRLVGAVTHVLVNDPTTGYGIAIGTMLDAAS